MGALASSPAPETVTERTIGDQSGKVFLITGATSGIGRELAGILYGAHAKVWIAARSVDKAQQTIAALRQAHPASRGELEFLAADFSDLATVKPAVNDFLTRESRLDVLVNNAGVMIPPKGTQTAQKFEAQLGVNVLAPYLFTKLLTPLLVQTAAVAEPSEVRVIWVSSSAVNRFAPQGGVDLQMIDDQSAFSQWQHYGVSKAGNILLAAEFGRQHNSNSIVSVALDPGNLDSDLYRHLGKPQRFFVRKIALKPAIYGAYTILFAIFSENVSTGNWLVPWGKVTATREDIAASCKPKNQGGTGIAQDFWEWCDKKTARYT